MIKPYKHCFYNFRRKSVYLKMVGDTTFKEFKYKKDYWVKDPSGNSEITDIYGVPMVRRTNYIKSEVDNIKKSGIPVAESDLRENVKFLHRLYDNIDLEADINDWNVCLFDIEIASGDGFPYAEKAEYPINLITCYSSQTKQTYTWGLQEYTGNDVRVTNYKHFDNEVSLLKDWVRWFSAQNFDVWSGWNSKLFDVTYIINRIKNLREKYNIKEILENHLSPIQEPPRKQEVVDRETQVKLGETYDIQGLVHLDYMELYKSFIFQDSLQSYTLNFVSNHELNKGKGQLDGSINQIYKTNWNQFVEYNVEDVNILVEIELKRQLFPLSIEYAYDCVSTLDVILNKVPTTTGYILKFLHRNKKVLNDKKFAIDEDWWHKEKMYIVKNGKETVYQNCKYENESKPEYTFEAYKVKAGYCYDYAGRYDNCMSFDITSSYPFHIMQYNISPEVKCIKPTESQINSGEVIETDINGVGFYRTNNAILPSVVKQVFDERKEYKKLMKKYYSENNKVMGEVYFNKQNVKKLIINSIYGVSLTKTFHLYDIDCARVILRSARVTLRDWLRRYADKYYVNKSFISALEKEFGLNFRNKSEFKVEDRESFTVHADTDSLYLCFNEAIERLKEEGVPLNTEIEYRNAFSKIESILQNMFNKVLEVRAKKHKVDNLIMFSRENIFLNMFCYAKKMYIGNIIDNEGKQISFDTPKHKIMGVSIKRSDMPEFCKDSAEKLAFDICEGQGYEKSLEYILSTYKTYKTFDIEELKATTSVSDYNKYIEHPIEHYIKNGLYFKKGTIFGARLALTWNFIIEKYNLPYIPIGSGDKFNYFYLIPKNCYNLDAIGFVGNYPDEFRDMFEVDYEVMFEKTFLPLFNSMFKILGWIGKRKKDKILLIENKFNDFFS